MKPRYLKLDKCINHFLETVNKFTREMKIKPIVVGLSKFYDRLAPKVLNFPTEKELDFSMYQNVEDKPTIAFTEISYGKYVMLKGRMNQFLCMLLAKKKLFILGENL